MKVKELFAAVRLYGLDVLFLSIFARLLSGLSKKLSMASCSILELVARKKVAKAEKAECDQEERAD